MRRLDKPTHIPEEVFLTCISKIDNPSLKKRLQLITAFITNAGEQYDVSATNAELHTFPDTLTVNGTVTVEEMKELYKSQVSAARGAARHIYNAIINAPRNNKCPLCGQGTVTTLDHHLPKSRYADIVVLPVNLVPCCSDCNKAKLATFPRTASEQTIHPYYDDFTNECWLYAKVLECSPPVLQFYTLPPSNWSDFNRARVERHFSLFKLSKSYASNSGNELINMRKRLGDLFDVGGVKAVRFHLEEQANTCRAAHINSWQTAMYNALHQSDWFCSEGFRLI